MSDMKITMVYVKLIFQKSNTSNTRLAVFEGAEEKKMPMFHIGVFRSFLRRFESLGTASMPTFKIYVYGNNEDDS